MKNKQVKLSGKEQAKINKRKKFYNKFERLCSNFLEQDRTEEIILLALNKQITFPVYDDLSILFQDKFTEIDEEFNVEDATFLSLPFLDDGRFLFKAAKSKLLKIIRQETKKESDGSLRKGYGKQEDSDDYNYQAAYIWGIQISNMSKLLELLAKEKENPTEYIVEEKTEERLGQRKRYRRAWRPRRRRR